MRLYVISRLKVVPVFLPSTLRRNEYIEASNTQKLEYKKHIMFE